MSKSVKKKCISPKKKLNTESQDVINGLMARMQNQKDFPSFYHTIVEINKTLKSDSSTATQIANIILQDYSLTNKLLRLVNSAFYGACRQAVSTVSEAVIRLGFTQVQMATASIMFFEQMQNNSQTQELKDESIRSLLSGLIGRELASKWKMENTEEAFICAMLHNLGRYLIHYYLPDEYTAVKDLMIRNNVGPQAASKAVLKISFDNLGMGVARYWGMPKEIVNSMEKASSAEQVLKSKKPLRKIVFLSDLLCDTAGQENKKIRNKSITTLKNKFNLEKKEIMKIFSSVWDDLNKYSEIFHINLDESPFINQFINNFFQKDDEVKPVPEAAGLADDFQIIISDGIESISNILLSEEYNFNDIISMVLELMYRGFGFSRVLICIIDNNTNKMVARNGLGENVEAFMSDFIFELTESSKDIFNYALGNSEDLYIESIHHIPNNLLIPDWYKGLSDISDLIIYPIIVKNKPIGLYYADRKNSWPKLSEWQFKYLKTLRNQTALTIKHMC